MEEVLLVIFGGVAGSLLTFIIGLFTLRFNYSRLHAEIVSKSRNEWINIFRESLSKFLSLADILRFEKNNISAYDEVLKEYHESKNNILIRLNLNEKKHQEVYTLINQIAYKEYVYDKEYSLLEELLLSVSRDILKEEWERVKKEAKGKK